MERADGKLRKKGKAKGAARSLRLLLLFGALSLSACATPVSLYAIKPAAELHWPPSPREPKIVWVASIAGSRDLGITKGFWKRLAELVVGEEEQLIVRPHGVMFDAAERLFIADPGAGVVHFMDLHQGRYAVISGENGSPLRTPIGLAEDDQGRVYITDSTSGTIFVYDIGHDSLKPFMHDIRRPTGIAFNQADKLLYIVDTAANEIVVADGKGRVVRRIGGTGPQGLEFNHPTDITTDARGQLYLLDPLNYRIKVLSPEGQLVSEFGSAGDMPGYLDKPKGVAVDSEGHIYCTDALLDTVQIFDEAGRLLLFFGTVGTDKGQFWMPSGIFIDRNDYIFVTDTYNRRIQVFRYLSQKPTEQGANRADRPVTTPPHDR
jgi:DNA-binding beta-propeller fold protein YncE